MQNRITPIPTRNFNAAGEYNNGQIFDRAYCPTGFTVHIPPDPVARLMYYLNSILNCTEMESQSEEIDIYRLAKCTEYLTLTSAEVKTLYNICKSLCPEKLDGKFIYQTSDKDPRLDNKTNRFLKYIEHQNSDFVIIGNYKVCKSNVIMLYTQEWARENYYCAISQLGIF